MTRTHEIYFSDLNEQAKKEYLEFHGVKSAEELNEGISPIATIELEEEEKTFSVTVSRVISINVQAVNEDQAIEKVKGTPYEKYTQWLEAEDGFEIDEMLSK